MTPWQRIRRKFVVLPSGCWEWQGARVNGGYGRSKFAGRYEVAHNVMFLVMHGSIDRAQERDHLCRYRRCINPFHIEQVPYEVNASRADPGQTNRGKTQCPWGHPYTTENTYMHNGHRFCRACQKIRANQMRRDHFPA
jgi:hypothetical protein